MRRMLGEFKGKGGKYYLPDERSISLDKVESYFNEIRLSGRTTTRKLESVKRSVRIDSWRNIRKILIIISKNPGITTNELYEKFTEETCKPINDKKLDYYNQILVDNNMGLDFYKSTKNGEKVRLSDPNSIKKIDKIIGTDKSKLVEEKEIKKAEKLIPISDSERSDIMSRLVEILYLDGYKKEKLLSVDEINQLYMNRNKRFVDKNLMIRLLSENPEILNQNGSYSVTNLYSPMKIANIDRSLIKMTVLVQPDLEREIENMKYIDLKEESLTLSEGKVYNIQAKNSLEFTREIARMRYMGIKILSPLYIRDKIDKIVNDTLLNLDDVL